MSTKRHTKAISRDFEPEGYLALGYITQAHGLQGAVRIHLHNPDISTIAELGYIHVVRSGSKKLETFAITNIREHPKGWLLDLEGCHDRNEAEALKRSTLYIDNKSLPSLEEDEFYYHQLEGLPVFSTTDEELGKVSAVISGPAYPILVVNHHGREVLVPLISSFVPDLDLAEKLIKIELIDGLFD